MFVVEVRPAKAWRGLRIVKNGGLVFRPTRGHTRASHWFAKSTAEDVLTYGKVRVGYEDKALTELDAARKGIRECECPTSAFPPRRRRRVQA